MKSISRLAVSLFLLFAFLSSTLPCGPGYTTPLFDVTSAPEVPYSDFAAGRLGIVKPTFRRSVLLAAYRYITGNGLVAVEQQAIIDVWKAEIDNKDFADNTIDDAVRAWVAKRKEVLAKEEKTPEIYVERTYGGYEFFPNCTRNAFETAAETLGNRVFSHGPGDANVVNWVEAQDVVFQNCSVGKQTPNDAPVGAPDWLQKDRAYQKAAAKFYSLDYEAAKRDFAMIAEDLDSPWAETSDYLVARTLIRQASLAKTVERAAPFYDEAEQRLDHFVSRSGKFAASAERLTGLIKYRRHPKERTSELARKLGVYGGNDNFRQDVIDYNWLLDKFESQILVAEQKRKTEEAAEKLPVSNANVVSTSDDGRYMGNRNTAVTSTPKNDDDLELNLYTNSKSYTIFVAPNATDDEAIAEAEKLVGQPLTEVQKTQVRSLRQSAYAGQFTANRRSDYEGSYWGDEKLNPTLVPEYLRQDDLTDWLYTYQMPGNAAYLYSLNKFKSTGAELWLMTAISRADKSSTDLTRILDAADRAGRTSPAYTTIAYHEARLLLATGKTADARKVIDDMLASGDALTISARNSFMGLKLTLTENLEDYLKYSLKRPYAFDFDGDVDTIDGIIAEQKKWYDPEYNKDGREAYDREIEERYKEQKLWQEREMFDSDTIEIFNQHFPTASLIDVMHSPALPDHLHERFAIAIFTRAYLLGDNASLNKIAPELIARHPEFETLLARVSAARTPAARENALLFFVLKNPLLSPYIEDGTGKTDNEQGQWDMNDWWCEPYDTQYDDATSGEVQKPLPPRPPFLTSQQSQSAQLERRKLKAVGDAPKFLAEKVMAWARRSPADRRVPEALYIMIEANGWTKYGCGNNEELRDEMATFLKKNYAGNEWTTKLASDEAGQ